MVDIDIDSEDCCDEKTDQRHSMMNAATVRQLPYFHGQVKNRIQRLPTHGNTFLVDWLQSAFQCAPIYDTKHGNW